jgi:hypothetical protein
MFASMPLFFVKNSRQFFLCGIAVIGAGAADGGEFRWGVNGHPLSQSAYFDVPLSAQVDLVADLGAGWYRVDLGAREFAAETARFDELLTDAERRNIRLLPVLLAPAAEGDGKDSPARARAAAFAFGRAVAGRYRGRITHWELGNELDAAALVRRGDRTRDGTLWRWGDPDGSRPGDFEEGRYQRARAEVLGLLEGVKAADPGALAIVDTAGWLHYGFIERLVGEDRVPFDIVAWHWYSEMGDIARVQGTLDLVERLGRFGKPVWITETSRRDGSRGGEERGQAEYLARDVARMGANPAIGGLFVYELLDEPYFGEAGESHYGLVEVARGGAGKWGVARRKPAFDAYRSVIAAQRAGAGAAR